MRSTTVLAFMGLLLLALTTGGIFFVARVDALHAPTNVVSLVHTPPALVDPTKTGGTFFPTNITIDKAVDIFTWQVTLTYDPTDINIVSMNVVNTYFDQCVDAVTMGLKFGTPSNPCNSAVGDLLLYNPTFIRDNVAGKSTLAYTMLRQLSGPQPQPLTCGNTPPAYPCPTAIVRVLWRVITAPGFSSIHILTEAENFVAGTGLADSTIRRVLYNTEDGFFSNIMGMVAPHASYTVTPTAPDAYPNSTVGRSVSFEGSASTGAVSFAWNFSDTKCTPQPVCSTGTVASTTHLYNAVDDQPPILTVSEKTNTGLKGQVLYLNVSESDIEKFIVSTTINWGDGNITRFSGEIPGSTFFNGVLIGHAYSKAGVFNVNVNATDALPTRTFLTVTGAAPGTMSRASRVIVFFSGNTVSKTLQNTIINILPVLSFTLDKTTAFKGDTITLTITASDPDGIVVSTRINWGDGSVQTFTGVPPPTGHSYANKGAYTLNVTAIDDDAGSTSKASTATVQDRPPTASFTFSPASPAQGDVVTFTDSSTDPDGTVTAWSWDFGDGMTSTDRSPTHKYSGSGTFTVKLTVTDNDGTTNTITNTITVQAPPIFSSPLVLAGVGLAAAIVIALLVWQLVIKKRRTARTPPQPPAKTS